MTRDAKKTKAGRPRVQPFTLFAAVALEDGTVRWVYPLGTKRHQIYGAPHGTRIAELVAREAK